ncbi:hypothetical protein ALC60_10219 [Trachymyrmex zeteki]|uniref:Uncharacterized protein n=1 Tax=Mycetomoellerius zeteki TaxID=64791 RepID=A0A151WS55_9HYME|nr:hypothetical protein ALC60_10219 [Trachymyrmex zeteki]
MNNGIIPVLGANTVVTPENIKILDECNDDDFNIDDKKYEIEVLVASKVNENIRNAGYLAKHNGHFEKVHKYPITGTGHFDIMWLRYNSSHRNCIYRCIFYRKQV